MQDTNYLSLSWSISRGRDTYGYNIARLDDHATGKRYRCSGGPWWPVCVANGASLAPWPVVALQAVAGAGDTVARCNATGRQNRANCNTGLDAHPVKP